MFCCVQSLVQRCKVWCSTESNENTFFFDEKSAKVNDFSALEVEKSANEVDKSANEVKKSANEVDKSANEV